MKKSSQPIKDLREELGLTQEEFADKIGITRQLLNHIENGYRDISKSTEEKLKALLHDMPMPSGFSLRYSQGQRFGKVLDALATYGITLAQLRDMEFKVKGSQLSSMYIGLNEIPKAIKTILVGKYNVNWSYVENGELPILKRTPETPSARINRKIPPLFKGDNMEQALDSILENDFSSWTSGDELFMQTRGIIKISNDSMKPYVDMGDYVAVSLIDINSLEKNQLVIIRTNNQKTLFGKVSKIKSNVIQLNFENPDYKSIQLDSNEVSFIFPVGSIIKVV
jgi:transcriptional regulator with XRE-family HTH domain